MKKTILPLLATMLILSSCEKIIDIDPSLSERKVVVTAMLDADSTASIRLTYSRFFLEEGSFEAIPDATISLQRNGTVVPEGFSYTDGRYNSACIVRSADRLSLSVDVPGHKTVTAETVVPSAPVVSDIHCVYTEEQQNGSLRFKLSDPAGEENFYSVAVYYEIDTLFERNYTDYKDFTVDTIIGPFIGKMNISCKDYNLTGDNSSLSSALEEEYNSTGIYFTDATINGRTYDVQININELSDMPYYYSTNPSDQFRPYSTPRFSLEVYSLNRDAYLYEISSLSQVEGEIFDSFNEPTQIHCNIKGGGIGIFAARSHVSCPATTSND